MPDRLVKGDRQPFPALVLELPQNPLLLFATKPLSVTLKELGEPHVATGLHNCKQPKSLPSLASTRQRLSTDCETVSARVQPLLYLAPFGLAGSSSVFLLPAFLQGRNLPWYQPHIFRFDFVLCLTLEYKDHFGRFRVLPRAKQPLSFFSHCLRVRV